MPSLPTTALKEKNDTGIESLGRTDLRRAQAVRKSYSMNETRLSYRYDVTVPRSRGPYSKGYTYI